MRLIERLSVTRIANERLKMFYIGNNFSLKTDYYKWLKQDFRYQSGVFLDYLAKENIGINHAHSGYILYILDNKEVDKHELNQDWLYEKTVDSLYIIDANKVEHSKDVLKYPNIMLQESLKHAILQSFLFISAKGRGYSISFDRKMKKHLNLN